MSKVFIAKIKGGKVTFESDYGKALFNSFLQDYEGKKLEIRLARNPISDEMRGYYFGVILPFFKSLDGWETLTHDQIHEILKTEFNGELVYNPIEQKAKKVAKSIMSDESNSTKAMEFLEQLRVYVAENYYKELPNPETFKLERDMAPMK